MQHLLVLVSNTFHFVDYVPVNVMSYIISRWDTYLIPILYTCQSYSAIRWTSVLFIVNESPGALLGMTTFLSLREQHWGGCWIMGRVTQLIREKHRELWMSTSTDDVLLFVSLINSWFLIVSYGFLWFLDAMNGLGNNGQGTISWLGHESIRFLVGWWGAKSQRHNCWDSINKMDVSRQLVVVPTQSHWVFRSKWF